MRVSVAAVAAVLIAGPAFAHVDPVAHGALAAGLAHPLLGADHLAAMLAVGILAATAPGRALWALPAAFVGAMVLGFGLALVGVAMPLAEPAILASVIVLGGLVALAVQLPLGGLLALGACFGLFHGAAHGAEVGSAGIAGFAAGMLMSTALLHGAGTLFARTAMTRLKAARAGMVLRGLGLGTALLGTGAAFA